MKPIDEQHIADPGLAVLDITGGDVGTVRAVMAALEERWATSVDAAPAAFLEAAGFQIRVVEPGWLLVARLDPSAAQSEADQTLACRAALLTAEPERTPRRW